MGSVCCSLGSFVSVVLTALERVTACTLCAMVACCLMFTILTVLLMGIGIGYHYCYVQHNINATTKAATTPSPTESPVAPLMHSVNQTLRSNFRVKRQAGNPLLTNEGTATNTTDAFRHRINSTNVVRRNATIINPNATMPSKVS